MMNKAETLEGVVIPEVIPLQSEPVGDGEGPQTYEVLRRKYDSHWFALQKGSDAVITHNKRYRLLYKFLYDNRINHADIREPMKRDS